MRNVLGLGCVLLVVSCAADGGRETTGRRASALVTFPVTVDVGELSYDWPTGYAIRDVVANNTVATFPGPTLATSLAEGDYAIVHESFGATGSANAPFHVGADGTISYAAALEGALTGAGTSALAAHGRTVHVDASPINAYRNIYMVGSNLSPLPYVRDLHLLPGPHGMLGVGHDFVVVADGTVTYTSADEGFFLGAGTSSLIVNGLVLHVDARDVSAYALFFRDGVVIRPSQPVDVHAFAGTFPISAPSGQTGGSSVNIDLRADGTVAYASELEGILTGAGTSSLAVHGTPIAVDASRLPYWTVLFSYFDFSSTAGRRGTARVLPGRHRIGYAGVDGSALLEVSVAADGLVRYAPADEGILGGNGTSSLVAYGRSVTIDSSGATPPGFILNPHLTATTQTVNLIPGTHFLLWANRTKSMFLTVTHEGTVDYPTAFDGIVFGRGGSAVYLGAPPPPPSVPPKATCAGTNDAPLVVATPPDACSVTLGSGIVGTCASTDGSPVSCAFDGQSAVTLGPGEHAVIVTATSASGLSSSCTSRVRVVDRTPPSISVGASPQVLWPNDGTLRPITLAVSSTDACTAAPTTTCSAVSSEPAGPANRDPDVVWTGGNLSLRADRNGKGAGRTYTITCNATDASGNTSSATALVTVPHDQRQ